MAFIYKRFGGIKMNCWKSIHIEREFGLSYIRGMSLITAVVAFIFSYLILSTYHGSHHVEEAGITFFLVSIICLPFLHLLGHVLPLILLKKPVKFTLYKKNRFLPICTYYTRTHLTKKVSILAALSPTFLITVPAIILGFYSIDYYVYISLFVSLHIGISFTDFIYISQIAKAPKTAIVEDGIRQFDVLLKDTNDFYDKRYS